MGMSTDRQVKLLMQGTEYGNPELQSRMAQDLRERLEAASLFSIQQFLTREAFRKRWDQGDAVYLHETFYSIMQAWDAGHLNVDIQVGGTDQLFNIMTASRRLMSARGQKPNVALIPGILPGTDGHVRQGDEYPGPRYALVLQSRQRAGSVGDRGHNDGSGEGRTSP